MTWTALDTKTLRRVKAYLDMPDAQSELDGQVGEWDPARWARGFPRERGYLKILLDQSMDSERGYKGITRGRVLELARGNDPLLTFMAAMVWGFGTRGRIEWLAGRALGYPVGKKRMFRIDPERAHGLIRNLHGEAQKNPVAAFEHTVPHGARYHLPGIGMSYATKFIYFAAFKAALDRGEAPALVLDQYVLRVLREPRTDDAQNYRAYLELARKIAGGRRPDLVEFALFRIGRDDAASRSKPSPQGKRARSRS